MSRYKSVNNIPVLKLGEDSSSSPNLMCDFFSGLTLRLCLAGFLGEAVLPTPDMVHTRALQFLKGDEGPTHLEPDILECEVKWALESITTNKASGGDGIPVEIFQILKDDAVKVLHSICQQIWKTQLWPQDWKRSVFIPIPKKGNAKECSNYHTIVLISHARKVMLKILQARLQQY